MDILGEPFENSKFKNYQRLVLKYGHSGGVSSFEELTRACHWNLPLVPQHTPQPLFTAPSTNSPNIPTIPQATHTQQPAMHATEATHTEDTRVFNKYSNAHQVIEANELVRSLDRIQPDTQVDGNGNETTCAGYLANVEAAATDAQICSASPFRLQVPQVRARQEGFDRHEGLPQVQVWQNRVQTVR